MAPKGSDVVIKAAKSPSGMTLQGYCDVLKGQLQVNEMTGKVMKKGEAALHVWTHAMLGDNEREDIFKTGCASNLATLLERGDLDERFGAIGCISALVLSEKHITEVVSNKVITLAANMLMGEHARSRLPAALLLSNLAQRAEYSGKVADVALLSLSSILMETGPGWAQAQQLQVHAAMAIKALIENVLGENLEVRQARRMALVNAGIIPTLVQMVGYSPRMPKPEHYPAAPPAISTKKGKSGKAKGDKKGGDEAEYPRGRKDCIATSSAACLRFMASCPGFVEQLMGSSSLQQFVDALLTSGDAQSAYISGILWEISTEQDVARSVIRCGAVSALLHVCSKNLAAAVTKKPKMVKNNDFKKDKVGDAPAPQNLADVAVCNATGALHHLTFIDEAKIEVGQVGGMPILVACLKTGKPQTYENATGALWNVGLDVNNTRAMQACSAPEFLSQPVPDSWLMDHAVEGSVDDEVDRDSDMGEEDQDDAPLLALPSRVFLTQALPT